MAGKLKGDAKRDSIRPIALTPELEESVSALALLTGRTFNSFVFDVLSDVVKANKDILEPIIKIRREYKETLKRQQLMFARQVAQNTNSVLENSIMPHGKRNAQDEDVMPIFKDDTIE